MDHLHVLLEFSFLLRGVITEITVVSQSFVLGLNVSIELKLPLSGELAVRTLECDVVPVDSLDVTVETTLAPQLQPAGLAVKPPSLVLYPSVIPQGRLRTTRVGAAWNLTAIVLQLMCVSNVPP